MKRSMIVVSLSIPLLIFMGLALLVFALEDRIIAQSVEHLNRRLAVRVDAESIRVSIFQEFPRVGVSLRRVTVGEDGPGARPPLLTLEGLTLRLHPLDALRGVIRIDGMTLSDGHVNLLVDQTGRGNFEIFTPNGATPSDWMMRLDMLTMSNVRLSFMDFRSDWQLDGLVESGRIRGDFSKGRNRVTLKARMHVQSLRHQEFHYLRGQDVDLHTAIGITPDSLTLTGVRAKLGRASITAEGVLGRLAGSPVRLRLTGTRLDIGTLLTLVAQRGVSPGFSSKGDINISMQLDGLRNSGTAHRLGLQFQSNRLSLQPPGKPLLRAERLSGSFAKSPSGATELRIDGVELSSLQSKLTGSLRVKNINAPLFHLLAQLDLSLGDAAAWGIAPAELGGRASGTWEMLGRIEDVDSLTIGSLANSRMHGEIDFEGISLAARDGAPLLSQLKGQLMIRERDLEVNLLDGRFRSSTFSGTARASNATAFLFRNGLSTIQASLHIDSLNTSQLLPGPSESGPFPLWSRVEHMGGAVTVGTLTHQGLTITDLSGAYSIAPKLFQAYNLSGAACGGTFAGGLVGRRAPGDTLWLDTRVSLSDIDIATLFRSFGNFNQDRITDAHISGRLSGPIELVAPLVAGSMDLNRMRVNANITLEQGRLRNVEALGNLSRFVALEELMDIHFETLENSISISNRQLIIPSMRVNSSALNLAVMGAHSFDGHYDYRFELLLSEVLFGKAKRRNERVSEFGIVEADGSRRSRLFLRLTGDREGHRVSFDGQAAREGFRASVRDEVDEVRQVFREEFAPQRAEGKAVHTPPPGRFGIEWEEGQPPGQPRQGQRDRGQTSPPPSARFGIEWEDE